MLAVTQQHALDRWFQKYSPVLVRYFHKKGRAADAEDLTQDVFLKLHGVLGNGTIENIDGYIFRVADSVMVGRLRRDYARGKGRETEVDDDIVDLHQINPELSLASKQEYARAMKSIIYLPERCRQAFLLHRFEGLTYAYIADHMSISVSAVEKLIARALARLARDLQQ